MNTCAHPSRKARAVTSLLTAVAICCSAQGFAQGTDHGLKAKADALFDRGEYAQAYPLYSQLVSLSPQDHDLNYRFGACTIYGGDQKAKAIGYLKYAVDGPATPALAWYFLGRAYQLDYRFDEAITAYQRYRGTADKKVLDRFPVDALVQQCRNGKYLLTNLKDITVLNKVEVASSDFFRFYDLSDIGGKIVVTPEELLTNLDKKRGGQFLTYLPKAGGPIYFSSYGKDGKTGKDIYRSELLPTGGYSTPVKLGGYINTDQDEDYAVMGPDGKTFYFCSKGHNSMGGYDVFKSNYDKGMDAFSAPENMDFAVNTPADELLYIVGPDGKEACFASDRDSKQGMENVYRVGTTQTPIHMTIFKGTYASAFDPSDRKARIVVEDGLTHERVAEVTTDMNGNYLLPLPRSGNYKFLVEGGPSGLAHLQNVDVPPNDVPKVYRQEIQLLDQGGEKLAIKSYFDQPLDDDAMALALDEIRRRAKLDVTGSRPAEPAAASAQQAGDPLQAAGFDGTRTLPEVMGMAQKNAADLGLLAGQQEAQANAAYNLTLQNVATAETESAKARQLVADAAGKPQDEKDRLMRAAGEAKQRSHEADLRARAAFSTARGMDLASKNTRQRAATANQLATTLAAANNTNDKATLVRSLTQLKTAIDLEKGPDRTLDEAERTRRAATQAAELAARKLKEADAQRGEEDQMNDRVARGSRDLAQAKGKKKDELARQQGQLEQQRAALHQEVEQAFGKAREAEAEAALARGQAALVQYLAEQPRPVDQGVDKGQRDGLEQRMDRVKASNAALQIDPQYGALATASAEEMERRVFDWGAREPVVGGPLATTRVIGQNGQGTGGERPGENASAQGTPNMPPTAHDDASAPVDARAIPPVQPMVQVADAPPGTLAAGKSTVGQEATGKIDGHPDQAAATGPGSHAGTAISEAPPAPTATAPGRGEDMANAAGGGITDPNGNRGIVDKDGNAADQVSPGAIAVAPVGADQAQQGQTASPGQNASAAGHAGEEQEERAFLLANKLAELEQLRQGEKNRAVRDTLDKAIVAQKALIKEYQAGQHPVAATTKPATREAVRPVQYMPLDYDPSSIEEQLAEEAYPGFALRRKAVLASNGNATDKANMIHALEMDLVDSIDAKMVLHTALLEAAPDKAEEILPRLKQWRDLKALHVAQADGALKQVDQTYAASESKAAEDAILSGQVGPRTSQGAPPSNAPHNDAYVNIRPDLDSIYASTVVSRTPLDKEAIAQMGRDLEVGAGLQAEVDSMEQVLKDMPAGKGYDKLRERTDRKIDDLLIRNVDLGQRSAFITRSEFKAAKDSSDKLTKELAKRGLPPDEPLRQMAQSFQAEADAAMDRGKGFRKEADRSGDIIRRNSLYRQAYGEELKALRNMDRAHTVRNYLLSGKMVPGEALTYEEVEARMFPGAAIAMADRNAAKANRGAADDGKGIVAAAPNNPAPMPPVAPPATLGAGGGAAAAAAADSTLLSGYLAKFYYLDPAERALVMGGAEERRYFLMKGRSIQGNTDALSAKADADGALKLSGALRQDADSLRNAAGTAANREQAGRLEIRAEALAHRSDSLSARADRLASAAAMDDAQAATLLGSLPDERSAAIMDLEQRKRRTEPVLANIRPAVAGKVAQPSAPSAPPIGAGASVLAQAKDPGGTSSTATARPDRTDTVTERLAHVHSPVTTPPNSFAGPLVRNVFEFTPAAVHRTEAIPIDAPMPEGVVYKVQVGAFRNALPAAAFSDMSPVTGERAANGMVRYAAGLFTSAASASEASAKVRSRGYSDAFVAAYIDGRRVPLREAMQAELRSGAVATRTPQPVPQTSGAGQPVETPAPVQLPQAASEAEVLANYPTTAEAVMAAFKPASTAYYNDPTAAPAKQVETVKGLFFTVQVGVYSRPTPLDKLFNITPLNSERTPNDKIRYTTGIYLDETMAQARRGTAIALGVKDAFITAYLNGQRIPMRDARVLLGKFGKAVLVDPALATK